GGQLLGQAPTVTQTGRVAYENSYTLNSVRELGLTGNPGVLEIANPHIIKPEQVTSAEVGYRGKFNNFIVDANAYFNKYKHFISQEVVVAPYYGTVGDGALSVASISNGDYQVYSAYTNSGADINSYGASIGLSTKILGNFDLSG